MTLECYVPFRIYVPAGQSTFSVPIPTYYGDRQFYFSYCTLTPKLFSDQAAKMNLDPPAELLEEYKYKIYYQGNFKSGLPLYPDTVVIMNTETSALKVVERINNFFESKKPIGLNHLGVFMDWYDVRYEDLPNTSWDAFVQQVMSFEYYGVPYNEKLHYNKLPVSARTVPGANNYLFPTSRVPDVMNNIRFRINIAPNTNVVFSTDSQLLAMGFTPVQIGKRKKNNKLKMENNSRSEYDFITAFLKPNLTFMKGNQLTIGLEPYSDLFVSEPFTFTITREENFKNLNYKIKLNEAMQKYAIESNLNFGFTYDSTAKKFSFEFPNNPSFDYFVIVIPTELSERLGFDLVTDIGKNNSTGKVTKDAGDFDIDETANAARALCLDTNFVVISDYYNTSNNTVGMSTAYLTALFPTSAGTSLETPMMESCHAPATMMLSSTLATAEGSIFPKFKLSRFSDDNKFINFVWTEGAYVCGTLRGKKIK